KDRFYGVVKCEHWDASLVNAPTAVWFPMHLHSPGQPVFISQGVYRGQLLVGDYDALNLSRIFLEQVNGEFQGALFPFSGGLASGGMRLLADGEDFYVGELAVYSHDGW